MKKNLTLSRWIIEKTDGDAYRAGRLQGEKHPSVDQRLINTLGGRANLLNQAKEMERDPELNRYIRFDWRDMGGDIRTIHYSVDIVPILCVREGMEDPLQKQNRQKKEMECFLEEAVQMRVDWLISYYNMLLEKIRQGKIVKEMEDEDWFRCLYAIAQIKNPVWKRVFSVKIFRDSKKFENVYEDRVITVLRNYLYPDKQDVMSDEEVLKEAGILTYAQTLEWKGAVVFELDTGKKVDTMNLSYGVILNAQTLEHSKPINLPGIRKIMTIENKANYENMPYREDTLYIYCHGFFSPKEVKFLQEFASLAAEDVEFLHWGDMDYGGIRIFLFNKEHIFRNLRPYRMNRESFEKAVNEEAGIKLEEGKRIRLEHMYAGELEELRKCILEYGMEIEQEMLVE